MTIDYAYDVASCLPSFFLHAMHLHATMLTRALKPRDMYEILVLMYNLMYDCAHLQHVCSIFKHTCTKCHILLYPFSTCMFYIQAHVLTKCQSFGFANTNIAMIYCTYLFNLCAGLVTKNMGDSQRINHLTGIFLYGNSKIVIRLAPTLAKELAKHSAQLQAQQNLVASLATRMGLHADAIQAEALSIHAELQALATMTDTLAKDSRRMVDLFVSLAKLEFLQAAGEMDLAAHFCDILPEAYSKVTRDASTVPKLQSHIKKLKKLLGLNPNYDFSGRDADSCAERNKILPIMVNDTEKRMQLDMALFWVGKRRAAKTASSAKERTNSRRSLYAKVVKPLHKQCATRNKLAMMLVPKMGPLRVKDLLSGEAQVCASDGTFAERRAFRDAYYLLQRLQVQVGADEKYMCNYVRKYHALQVYLVADHSRVQTKLEDELMQNESGSYSLVLETTGRLADIGTGLRFATDQLLRARTHFPSRVFDVSASTGADEQALQRDVERIIGPPLPSSAWNARRTRPRDGASGGESPVLEASSTDGLGTMAYGPGSDDDSDDADDNASDDESDCSSQDGTYFAEELQLSSDLPGQEAEHSHCATSARSVADSGVGTSVRGRTVDGGAREHDYSSDASDYSDLFSDDSGSEAELMDYC